MRDVKVIDSRKDLQGLGACLEDKRTDTSAKGRNGGNKRNCP